MLLSPQGIVAFSLWLLAVVAAVHWAEMVSLAARWMVVRQRVPSTLSKADAELFRTLQDHSAYGRYWWTATVFAIVICMATFGSVFVVCLVQATESLAELQPAFVSVGALVALSSVGVGVIAGVLRWFKITRMSGQADSA